VAEAQGWPVNTDLLTAISLERRLSRHAVLLTGSTRAVLDLVGPDYEVPSGAMRRVPLGMGAGVASTAAGDAEAARANTPLTVLFAGRLESRKGIEALTAAIEILLEREPNARYLLAGDDALGLGRTWLEKLRWKKGVQAERVEVLGRVSGEQLDNLYQQCSVFVAPSLWESFGLVFLEAMSHGKPVVGTTAGGIGEVVEDGVTGILVRPGEVEELAAAILSLLEDPVKRSAMGQAGLRRWRRLFSREAMAAATLDAYREAMRRRREVERIIYRATAPEFLRTPEAAVVWRPDARTFALRSEGKGWRTCVYGPYMTVPAGSWRADFMLWAEGDLEGAADVARVETFCGSRGYCESKQVQARQLGPGGGTAASVFFTLSEPFDNFEFRVHACSAASVFVREIQVSAWPVHGTEDGLDAEFRQRDIEEVGA